MLLILLLLLLTSQCNSKTIPTFPTILVFGDSSVDTGNNNYIITPFKGDHPPYGIDFPGRVPTGRFSNGKLVPDILATLAGLKESVPPFLAPNLSDADIVTGVSFASAGSGYDELTTTASHVIPVSSQPGYFRDYIRRLEGIVGGEEASRILARALVIVSAGTNDFIFNFYDTPTRRVQFGIHEYQDYLQNKMRVFHDFVETRRGCCGTGLVEAGPFCTRLTPICQDHQRYVFWDSIHPGETTYTILSKTIFGLLSKWAHLESE